VITLSYKALERSAEHIPAQNKVRAGGWYRRNKCEPLGLVLSTAKESK
jgi:hypothetical protein